MMAPLVSGAAPVALLAAVPIAASAQAPSTDSLASACAAQDTATYWRKVGSAWSNDSGRKWTNNALRRRLLALGDADQAIRSPGSLADSMSNPAFALRVIAADSANAVTFATSSHAMDGRAGRWSEPRRPTPRS